MPILDRLCPICCKSFTPNKHAGDRQKICGEPSCKKAAKKQRQADWCARNADYFRGPENTQRVQQWRRENPDWRQRQAASRQNRRNKSSSRTKSCNADQPAFERLQDSVPDPQSALLVGLAAAVSGSALQDEVHDFLHECLRRGGDLLRPDAGCSPFLHLNPHPRTHGKTPDRSRADPPLAPSL